MIAPILRALPAMPFVLLIGLFVAAAAQAHNNPSFREDLLLTIEVAAEPLSAGGSAYSPPFELVLPKGTVELVWRINGPAREGISFSVAENGVLVADQLADGVVSKILRGQNLTIADVAGASEPFTIEIYAKVIDRSA